LYFNIRNTLPKFFTFLPGHTTQEKKENMEEKEQNKEGTTEV
jgi:hypothetical protein